MGAEDSIRTIIKFLSQEPSQDRELAVSLLYELSKSEILCEKIGSVYGAILILVGMASSKSENISTVEKILDNLEKSEENIKQMAENGRLQPLLTLLLEGSSCPLSLSPFCCISWLIYMLIECAILIWPSYSITLHFF